MGITNRLNSTVTILRKSRSDDGRGGSTITYATATSSINVRISIKSSKERSLGNKIDSEATHKIFTLSTLTVKIHDRFNDGTDNYEILGINKPSRGNHLELDAVVIRDES